MATKQPNSEGLQFLVEGLKANKDISYGALKAEADKKGLTVYPIMFGRAKLLLGYSKPGKDKAKRAAGQKTAKVPRKPSKVDAPSRGPGRPRKSMHVDLSGLDGVVAMIRQGQQDLDRYRRAFTQIAEVVESML